MRILLVEDDESLGAGVRDARARARHAVEWGQDHNGWHCLRGW